MATKKKVSRKKWNWLKFRKGDHAHNLMVAAQRWIHANGGTAVVLGGVGLIDLGTEYKYGVVVSAVGKRPDRQREVERG